MIDLATIEKSTGKHVFTQSVTYCKARKTVAQTRIHAGPEDKDYIALCEACEAYEGDVEIAYIPRGRHHWQMLPGVQTVYDVHND